MSAWTTIKPDFKEECTLVTANLVRGLWEYDIWIIQMFQGYMAWMNGEGEEYGDLADLHADKYLILPAIQ